MERTNRAVTSRKNRTNAGNVRGMYVDGNAVRRLQEVPARKYQTAGVQTAKRVREERAAEKSRQLSREAQRNREKAQSMGRGFVLFLAVVSVAVLFCCVNYLQLQAKGTRLQKQVTALETQLDQAKLENDSNYNQIMAGVDMEHIKDIAMNEYGMTYAAGSQIVEYELQDNDYVRQYSDVPEE